MEIIDQTGFSLRIYPDCSPYTIDGVYDYGSTTTLNSIFSISN
jgi:hypothetical protein